MKVKSLSMLLLSLFTASAFAHSYHDDEISQPPLKQEAAKKPDVPAPKAKQPAAPRQDQSTGQTPAPPAAAEPKKTP